MKNKLVEMSNESLVKYKEYNIICLRLYYNIFYMYTLQHQLEKDSV